MKLICLVLVLVTFANADWWENAIFYQIYPRSFKDSNNDGIGDIRGIIQKLPYLKETGVTATWLSPILQSPQVDFGYDISDFKVVDPMFGTNEELNELFREAKKLGIKVIMDFVPNHTSDQHEWFLKSIEKDPKYDNYYVWHNGKANPNGGRALPPNNWQAVFGTRAWTWNEKRQQYYLHQFTPEQPDLNYRNPEVIQDMKDVLTFWMDQGADGFRIDAINHMFETEGFPDEPFTERTDDPNNYDYTHHIYTKDLNETYDMVQQWRVLIDAYNQEKGGDTRVLFTEAYASIEDTMRYFSDENGAPRAHFPFNFLMIEKLSENSNAYQFKNEIDIWMSHIPAGATSNWVLGNHDKPRFGTRYGIERIDGLLTLLLTLPGVAVTYNGDEIGMEDYRDISWEDTQDPPACNLDPETFKDASRDPVRTPFQWDGTAYAGFKEETGAQPWVQVHPNYTKNNLALHKAAPKSFYKLYQQLAKLRNEEVFVKGTFKTYAINEEVFAYERNLGSTSCIILINFRGNEHTIDINDFSIEFPQQSQVVLAGTRSSHENGDIVMSNNFRLRAFDAVVLKASTEPQDTTPQQSTSNAPTTPVPPETTTPDAASTLVGSFILLISSLFLYHCV